MKNIFSRNLDVATCRSDYLFANTRHEAIAKLYTVDGSDCNCAIVLKDNLMEVVAHDIMPVLEEFTAKITSNTKIFDVVKNSDGSGSFVVEFEHSYATMVREVNDYHEIISKVSIGKFLEATQSKIRKLESGKPISFETKPLVMWQVSVNWSIAVVSK